MSSRPTEGEPISKTNQINYLTVTNLNGTSIEPRSPTELFSYTRFHNLTQISFLSIHT